MEFPNVKAILISKKLLRVKCTDSRVEAQQQSTWKLLRAKQYTDSRLVGCVWLLIWEVFGEEQTAQKVDFSSFLTWTVKLKNQGQYYVLQYLNYYTQCTLWKCSDQVSDRGQALALEMASIVKQLFSFFFFGVETLVENFFF